MKAGNTIVNAVAEMNITGNVIPESWYKTIQYSNGKVNVNAILVLSEIVYWYRPKAVADEQNHGIAYEKKFKDEAFPQLSYEQIMSKFCLTKDQTRAAVIFLEQETGVIKRHFKEITVGGRKMSNVMFIELFPDRLKAITLCDSDMGAMGLQPHTPVNETSQPHDCDQTSVPFCKETNTKNTTKTITENDPPFHLSWDDDIIFDDEDDMDYQGENIIPFDVSSKGRLKKRIKRNLEYDLMCIDYGKEKMDETIALMMEPFLRNITVNVNGCKVPNDLVRERFLSLRAEHICYVFDAIEESESEIRDIRAYMLATLYNAPLTMNAYYDKKAAECLRQKAMYG